MKQAYKSYNDCAYMAKQVLDAATSGAIHADDLIVQINVDGRTDCFFCLL